MLKTITSLFSKRRGKTTSPNAAENTNQATDINTLKNRAEKGCPESQYALGKSYIDNKEIDEGLVWMAKSAESGYAPAVHYIGVVSTLKQDYAKAFALFSTAADLGYAESQYKMSNLYFHGQGTEKNPILAFYWCEKAACQNMQEALFTLALFYEDGYGTEKNPKKAFEALKKAAELGNTASQAKLADLYALGGEYVKQDFSAAFKWTKKAAENNNAYAQFNLAKFYEDGTGTEKNGVEAHNWYLKAAESGYHFAQNNLAWIYQNGLYGFKQDYKKAFDLYQKASASGDAHSQGNLAYMYHKGLGIAQNTEKAVEWYIKSANAGTLIAQYNLGTIYDSLKNYAESFKWFKMAADKGFAPAQYAAGRLYIIGDGGVKDIDKGLRLINDAARGGDENAIKFLQTMLKKAEIKNAD